MSALFSAAAFRAGRALLNDDITQISESGDAARAPPRGAFMTPELARDSAIDGLLRGMASTVAQEADAMIADSAHNFLLTNIQEEFPAIEGIGLAARSIQHWRDRRIPAMSAARRALGLPARRSFSEISSGLEVVEAILSLRRSLSAD